MTIVSFRHEVDICFLVSSWRSLPFCLCAQTSWYQQDLYPIPFHLVTYWCCQMLVLKLLSFHPGTRWAKTLTPLTGTGLQFSKRNGCSRRKGKINLFINRYLILMTEWSLQNKFTWIQEEAGDDRHTHSLNIKVSGSKSVYRHYIC